MIWARKWISLVAVISCGLGVCASSDAAMISLGGIDTGWYRETDSPAHFTSNLNYITGNLSGQEYRSFYVFDLSAITEPISGATLRAFNRYDGYSSIDSSETLALFDVSTSISSLTAGTGGASAFSDLGGGTTYGSTSVSSADNGKYVSVPINAPGLSALNLATGQFAIGGAITTLRSSSSFTERVFGNSFDEYVVYLDVTTQAVPEPTSLALLGMTALGFCGVRLRRRRDAASPDQSV